MTHFKSFHKYLLVVISLLSFQMFGQETEQLWRKSSLSNDERVKSVDWNKLPMRYMVYELDESGLTQKIGTKSSIQKKNTEATTLSFPNMDGEMEAFTLVEKSIFAPELQAKFPEIRSYTGRSIKNPSVKIRLSTSPYGVNATIYDKERGTFYIDKVYNSKSYVAYKGKDANRPQMECLVEDQVSAAVKSRNLARTTNANDGNLRTFRLAVATTGEYSQYHIIDRGVNANAPDSEKIAAVMDAINVAMTRVNEIFERDVAIKMELIGNNDQLIFLDADTDGFSNNNTNQLIEQSQTKIDDIIGSANYDIGHTFSTGAGGLAQLSGTCSTSKARGVTGITAPKGDKFYVDFVAHEMGHQFGANHTFNGTAENCLGNENSASAVEPGSGTTIMAYAGICSPQNVQENGDDYFHLVSIREMWANITEGISTCAEITTTENSAPIIEPLENYTIPISTPFALTANATDAQDDLLTYTWEQLDSEPASIPLVSTATGGPAFRSLRPSDSPTRYFPRLQTTLGGATGSQWEVLPSVERTMNFGVTVRDNNSLVGQTASDETFLTVSANAGPFVVTSQNSAVNWDAGTTQTVTWDVANTNAAPVNCESVNILLSHDGGLTFSEVLASNVPNDGSQNIVAPKVTTTNARIMVQSVGNVFFAVNAAEFSIQDSEFIMEFDTTTQEVCAPASATYNFTFKTFLDFNESTTFSASGNPDGTTVSFDPASAIADGTAVTMTIQGLTAEHIGSHEISVTGTSSSVTKNTMVVVNVFGSEIALPELQAPANGSTNIIKPYVLEWNNDENVKFYRVQIATDANFETIVEENRITTNSYAPQNLMSNVTYYWRVKGRNDCADGSYSQAFSFSTENEVCNEYESTDTPVNIFIGEPTDIGVGSFVGSVTATTEIQESIVISDLNVEVSIDHTWIGDISMVLSDEHGNNVILVSADIERSGTSYTNTVFDSEADIPVGSGLPPLTGSFIPEGNLKIYNGLDARGTWTLTVTDNFEDDIGVLESFKLHICGVPQGSEEDNDGDGVLNENDACPNTPFGVVVNDSGCIVEAANLFTVETTSETCEGLNNGQIAISAGSSQNYTAEFNGVMYNFTKNQVIEDVSPGNYDLCISIDGDDFIQCYNLNIDAGGTISAKSALTKNKLAIEIESGTAPFKVFKNDDFLFETMNDAFEVTVSHGDVINVTTKEDCEGVFEKTIDLLEYVTLYPNPAEDYFNIAIPTDKTAVRVEMFTTSGQVIRSQEMKVEGQKIIIDSASLPQGIYFVRVVLEEPITLKMVKQ